MGKAKIRLSQKETELIVNAEFILTKNAILEKVKLLLLELQDKQQGFLRHPQLFLEGDGVNISPKISKGESYKNLPYLILDYPRIFKGENIFAIRTMFWWGHFFSITLHLSGNYKKKWEERLIASHALLIEQKFFYCVNQSPWKHDFDTSNYLPISTISKNNFDKSIYGTSFTKLAIQIPLHQWNDAPDVLFNYFRKIIEILAA